MEKIKKRATDQSTLFFQRSNYQITNSLIDINNYSIIIITLQDIFCIPKRMGGRFMKLTELQELIKKYGDVTFLEIKEELKKLGYSCKIAGEKNA